MVSTKALAEGECFHSGSTEIFPSINFVKKGRKSCANNKIKMPLQARKLKNEFIVKATNDWISQWN